MVHDRMLGKPMDITALPFNHFLGISPAEKDGAVLWLPNDRRYTNHIGSVHASALMALAEATSGAYLIAQFTGIGIDVVPVVRRADFKFRKPALGAVFSSVVELPDDKRNEFISTLINRGRALLEIHVDVHDEHGTHALTAAFEWFVAKRE